VPHVFRCTTADRYCTTVQLEIVALRSAGSRDLNKRFLQSEIGIRRSCPSIGMTRITFTRLSKKTMKFIIALIIAAAIGFACGEGSEHRVGVDLTLYEDTYLPEPQQCSGTCGCIVGCIVLFLHMRSCFVLFRHTAHGVQGEQR
jgi:hypothetical protein